MRYYEAKVTSKSSSQISVAVIESEMLTFHNHQQRLNYLSLMSIESELLRKQNFWQAGTWICLQKSMKSTIIVWVFNMVGKTELFRIPEFMIGQTFSLSRCISTLFIWCCRVCYFVSWTRVFWGHHVILVFIEKMGPRTIVPQGPWNPHLALVVRECGRYSLSEKLLSKLRLAFTVLAYRC